MRSTKRFALLFVILISVLLVGNLSPQQPAPLLAQGDDSGRTGLRPDAPTYGVRGPYTVGYLVADSGTGDYMADIHVWYPTTDAEIDYTYEIRYEAVPLPLDVYGHAALNGVPDLAGGPYPLVVYSPAASSPPQMWAYYLEHLASYGFVVISSDTEDNFGVFAGDYGIDAHRFLISRPKDASRLLDFAETLAADDGALAGMIDMERVAATGMSRGGSTVLALAGAQLDMDFFATACEATPDDVGCADILGNLDAMAELAGLDAVPTGLWPSTTDPRVDVVVAVVPASPFFGPAGEAPMDKPVMVIAAELDGYWAYADLGSEQKTEVVFQNAAHLIHIVACDDAPVLAALGYNTCADMVWDQDRAHDLLDHFATAFLLAQLYEDAEAAAALSPDVVQFPGIRYETTNF